MVSGFVESGVRFTSNRAGLQARCEKAGIKPEWQAILRDLDRLQEVTIEHNGEPIILRTPTQGTIGPIFKAAGIALPKKHPTRPILKSKFPNLWC